MNSPEHKLNPHLEAALQRIRTAADQAAERSAEGMGVAALSATQARRRDDLLAAQFLFRRQMPVFNQQFTQTLREQVLKEMAPREPVFSHTPQKVELSLMDDDAVEDLVAGDRVGLAIGHQSEWELREVDAYIGGLVATGATPPERNPLRPEVVGRALLAAVRAIADEAELRQILIDELARALSLEMRSCYADIVDVFRNRGVHAQDLRIRPHSGHERQRNFPNSQSGAATGQGDLPVHGGAGGAYGAQGGHGGQFGGPHGGYGHPGGGQGGFGGGPAGRGPVGGQHSSYGGMSGFGGFGHYGDSGHQGRMIGAVDAEVMSLLRRLSVLPMDGGGHETGSGTSYGHAGAPSGGTHLGYDVQMHDSESGVRPLMAPNLIRAHREELRQAASAPLDHMVIDVVGSLFDQILSDPKVPPQMARLVARLQLPVLRVALGDVSFFSSRRHPVRRFVNRVASLACAFDDFTEDPGRQFLTQARELIDHVAEGDFDRMDVYEQKLDALEAFIAEQNEVAAQAHGDIPAMLARKEMDLRLQQRYLQQLQSALGPVVMPEFLREFLAQVWSQAIILAARRHGPESEVTQRLRLLGRELVMSVQPKGSTRLRQTFLGELPRLMKTLNEGLDLIAWPESARKGFFGELLPAHADSLKGQALSPLDQNLLIKQLDSIFQAPLPREEDLSTSGPVSLPQDLDVDERFSAAEASQAGLVPEAKVDWQGEVDIDLSAEAPLQAQDIKLEGLPEPEPIEPTSGAQLIDHLQVGFAYQLHTEGKWLKVRLSHISPGRSFFMFTHGLKHQESLTMTARMLKRLCETDRLRAFENAYLLERATARARKQLAALGKQAA